MSLKIERDTVQKVTESVGGGASAAAAAVAGAPRDGPLPGTSGKHPFAEAIGTALTGGKKNAGTKGYLMVRYPEPSLLSRLVAVGSVELTWDNTGIHQ